MSVKSKTVITSTGAVRDVLAAALERSGRGDLSAADGKNMIGLANQITNSINSELKHQAMQSALGLQAAVFGQLNIGG